MGARVEQSGEFLPRTSRARRRHLEDMADSLHRLPSAADDLCVIIPCRNRALLLQGEFCITLRTCCPMLRSTSAAIGELPQAETNPKRPHIIPPSREYFRGYQRLAQISFSSRHSANSSSSRPPKA